MSLSGGLDAADPDVEGPLYSGLRAFTDPDDGLGPRRVGRGYKSLTGLGGERAVFLCEHDEIEVGLFDRFSHNGRIDDLERAEDGFNAVKLPQ